MDAQVVQEFNGDTGKWDTLPPDPPADATPKETPAAPVSDDAPKAPVVEAKAAEKVAKPRNDSQARIDQAIARQREAERKAEDAERRARELETRTKPEAKTEPKAAAPDRFATLAEYVADNPDASLEDWIEARDTWKDQRREAAQREQQDTQRADQTFTAKATAFRERWTAAPEDVRAKLDPALFGVKPYSTLTKADKEIIRAIPDPAERDAVAFRCFLADHWIESEHAIALLEHLSDPEQFQRLATLPPNQVIRALAKLEAGFGAATPAEPAPKPKARTSQAAPPITPLGSSPHVPDDGPLDEDDDETWRKKEEARVLRQRRSGRG